MDKKEILEKSRKENKNQDEYEKYALAQGGQWAMAVGGVICMFIALFDAVTETHFPLVPWSIYLSMVGTSLFVKSRYLHQRNKMAFGVLLLLLAVVMLVIHICEIMGW